MTMTPLSRCVWILISFVSTAAGGLGFAADRIYAGEPGISSSGFAAARANQAAGRRFPRVCGQQSQAAAAGQTEVQERGIYDRREVHSTGQPAGPRLSRRRSKAFPSIAKPRECISCMPQAGDRRECRTAPRSAALRFDTTIRRRQPSPLNTGATCETGGILTMRLPPRERTSRGKTRMRRRPISVPVASVSACSK